VESNQPLTSESEESKEGKKGICTVTRQSTSRQGTIYSQSEYEGGSIKYPDTLEEHQNRYITSDT
jgi:hypothetical protein